MLIFLLLIGIRRIITERNLNIQLEKYTNYVLSKCINNDLSKLRRCFSDKINKTANKINPFDLPITYMAGKFTKGKVAYYNDIRNIATNRTGNCSQEAGLNNYILSQYNIKSRTLSIKGHVLNEIYILSSIQTFDTNIPEARTVILDQLENNIHFEDYNQRIHNEYALYNVERSLNSPLRGNWYEKCDFFCTHYLHYWNLGSFMISLIESLERIIQIILAPCLFVFFKLLNLKRML
ncbi:hypothetical protein [Prochlorococcus marinus]|uniref:hypothetical protein n=1 Tax=Prochlorococcus marinus TaxID=1219 RepID=UPI0039AFC7A4